MLVNYVGYDPNRNPLTIDKVIVVVFHSMESEGYMSWLMELSSTPVIELARRVVRQLEYDTAEPPHGYRQIYIERNLSLSRDSDAIDPHRYYPEGEWVYATPQEVLDHFVGYNNY